MNLQGAGGLERFHARIDASEPDQPGGVTEIPVEDGQIAPRGVVGDVADLRVDAGGGVAGGQFLRQIGDLLAYA